MDRKQVQQKLDSFVVDNRQDIERVEQQNPQLYNVIMSTMHFLGERYGTGTIAPAPAPAPVSEPAPAPKPVSGKKTIKEEIAEVVESVEDIKKRMQEISDTIEGVELLAEMGDDEAIAELKALKKELSQLKKKLKS